MSEIVIASALVAVAFIYFSIIMRRDSYTFDRERYDYMYVLKYLFLFLGIALVINTFALMRTVAVTDSESGNTTGALDDSIMMGTWFLLFPATALFLVTILVAIIGLLKMKKMKAVWGKGGSRGSDDE